MRNSKMRDGVKEFYNDYKKCHYKLNEKDVNDVYFDYRYWFEQTGKSNNERIELVQTFEKYWLEMLGL